MGLTCQLLGHQFGEPTTERMREERGGEMVTTEREVRVCARCGDRLVISQNTEVVAIRTAGSGRTDGAPQRAARGGDPHMHDIIDPSLRPTPAPTTGDAAGPPDPAPRATSDTGGSGPEPPSSSGTGALAPGEADPADEDAEILEAPTSTPERPPGRLDDQPEGAADPPATDADEAQVDTITSAPDTTGSIDTVRDSDAPVDVADLPDEAVEFHCPACGYAVAATLTSMRSGDICPACREGYIDERARRQ